MERRRHRRLLESSKPLTCRLCFQHFKTKDFKGHVMEEHSSVDLKEECIFCFEVECADFKHRNQCLMDNQAKNRHSSEGKQKERYDNELKTGKEITCPLCDAPITMRIFRDHMKYYHASFDCRKVCPHCALEEFTIVSKKYEHKLNCLLKNHAGVQPVAMPVCRPEAIVNHPGAMARDVTLYTLEHFQEPFFEREASDPLLQDLPRSSWMPETAHFPYDASLREAVTLIRVFESYVMYHVMVRRVAFPLFMSKIDSRVHFTGYGCVCNARKHKEIENESGDLPAEYLWHRHHIVVVRKEHADWFKNQMKGIRQANEYGCQIKYTLQIKSRLHLVNVVVYVSKLESTKGDENHFCRKWDLHPKVAPVALCVTWPGLLKQHLDIVLAKRKIWKYFEDIARNGRRIFVLSYGKLMSNVAPFVLPLSRDVRLGKCEETSFALYRLHWINHTTPVVRDDGLLDLDHVAWCTEQANGGNFYPRNIREDTHRLSKVQMCEYNSLKFHSARLRARLAARDKEHKKELEALDRQHKSELEQKNWLIKDLYRQRIEYITKRL